MAVCVISDWTLFISCLLPVLTEDLSSFGVRFRLYGTERMRRERMIGETVVGFASLNTDTATTQWLTLEPRSNIGVSPDVIITIIILTILE